MDVPALRHRGGVIVSDPERSDDEAISFVPPDHVPVVSLSVGDDGSAMFHL